MSVLSRLGASVGIGNLSVKVNVPSRICIGEPLQGTVVITGGNVEQTAQRLWVGIRLGWETEDEDRHTQRHYAVLNEHLSGRKYMVGDSYTIVDMALWGWARMAVFVMGEEAAAKYPNVKLNMMEQNDVANFSPSDPRFPTCGNQPPVTLKRHAQNLGGFYCCDHLVSLFNGHCHRLAQQNMLARLRRPNRQIRNLAHWSRNQHNIHIFALQQTFVIFVRFDVKGTGEFFPLRLIVPSYGDQFRFRIFRQRPRQVIC